MEKEVQEVLKTVKKSSKLRLQEREYEVLAELERWGLLGLGQLESLFFRQGSWTRERVRLLFNEYDREAYDRYGYKRLFRLEKTRYIRRFYHWFGSDGHYYWGYGLTRLGKAELDQARLSQRLGLRRDWSNRVVLDYIRLNGVGLALAKVLGLNVTSRHQLACESRAAGLTEVQVQSRIPDLRIEGKIPLPVMVGMNLNWTREQRRWKADESRLLLYLTSDVTQREVLWRARDAGAHQVYVGDLREFQEKLGETILTNPDKTTATLDQLIGRSGQSTEA